jgi:hypothetical protein
VLSRRNSWLCGARIHKAVVERGAGEPVSERGMGLECQRVHRAVAERET